MSEKETIKEFLVNIGYRVDGASEKRFRDGLANMTKLVLGLGAAAVAATSAVVVGVVRMSRSMEDLYYASQRTGSTVASINALGFAASQMGSTVEDARAGLEGLAQRMRTNPGYGALIQSLIGAGTDLTDTTSVIDRLAVRFREMPYYLANAYAQALGISEPLLRAMIQGMDRFNADYRARLRAFGVDSEEAARIGLELTREYRVAVSNLEMLGNRLLVAVGPQIEEAIRGFNRFLVENQGSIVAFFTFLTQAAESAGRYVAAAFRAIRDALQAVSEYFGETDMSQWFRDTEGQVDALRIVFAALAAYIAGAWAAKMLAGFAAVSAGLAGGVLGRLLRLGPLGVIGGVVAPGGGNNEAEDLRAFQANPGAFLNQQGGGTGTLTDDQRAALEAQRQAEHQQRVEQEARTLRETLMGFLRQLFGFEPADAGTPARPSSAPSPGASSGVGQEAALPPGSPAHQQRSARLVGDLMRDFGLTRDQAAGLVGNLDTESGLRAINEINPLVPGSRGGFGYAQWTGPRRRAFEAWAAERNLDLTSYEANYGFLQHELRNEQFGRSTLERLGRVNTPGEAARAAFPFFSGGDARVAFGRRYSHAARAAQNFRRMEEMPGGPFSAPPPGGATAPGGVVLNQQTQIIVEGTTDPRATAGAVAAQQGRVNADLERNMRGAIDR